MPERNGLSLFWVFDCMRRVENVWENFVFFSKIYLFIKELYFCIPTLISYMEEGTNKLNIIIIK